MRLLVYIDGRAQGDPGPAGAGVVIADAAGTLLHEGAYFLGPASDGAAAYHALLLALARAAEFAPGSLVVHTDRPALISEVTGESEVAAAPLAELHGRAQLLLLRVGMWSLARIPAHENRRAGELAELALERGADVVVTDAQQRSARGPATASASPSAAAQLHDAPLPPATFATMHVSVATPAARRVCPAAGLPPSFEVRESLPPGLCLHAAHALLPTLLALADMPAGDLRGVPPLTLRCDRAGCGAAFVISPRPAANGHGGDDA